MTGRKQLKSSEEIVGQDYKPTGQSNVDKRDLVINKTGLKGDHLKHMHRNKKVLTGKLTSILWNQQDWDTSLTCLYTNACSSENKWEELEAWLYLQGYNLIMITKMQQDGSHSWSTTKDRYRFFGEDRPGQGRERVASYERQWWERMELCLGMDNEPAGTLWASVRAQSNLGSMVVGVRYRPPDQEKVESEAFSKHFCRL